MKKTNVLLTTAGRKAYLARIFRASNRAGRIVAVDSDPLSPMRHHADHFEVVPSFDSPDRYLDALLALCREYAIDCVLPQNDMELALLADARGDFDKEGVAIAGIPADLVRLVADKYALAEWMAEHGYHYPRTWLCDPVDSDVRAFVEKDRFGQGSAGLVYREGPSAGGLPDGKVVQERIDGDEYNLDILRDAEGHAVAVSVKKKLLMLHGSTDRAVSVDSPELEALGARLGEDLRVFGSIDVDLLLANDTPTLIDVNPRIGGGFPFTAAFFPAYVDALLEVCGGRAVDPLREKAQPGTVVCREYTYS